MADSLSLRGKFAGMTGIRNEISKLELLSDDTTPVIIATATVTGDTTNFPVSLVNGEMANGVTIEFTIGPEDVDKVAAQVRFIGVTDDTLMTLDLDTPKTLDVEGTASFAVGELTATL